MIRKNEPEKQNPEPVNRSQQGLWKMIDTGADRWPMPPQNSALTHYTWVDGKMAS
jgi:hypothetical protein